MSAVANDSPLVSTEAAANSALSPSLGRPAAIADDTLSPPPPTQSATINLGSYTR
jgi:hypothetical protein